MNSNIVSNLAAKYNIQDIGIFSQIAKMALLGELEQKKVGYSLQKALNLELAKAVDLAVEIQFLSNKEKEQIINELSDGSKQQFDINAEINNMLYQNNISVNEELSGRLMKLISSYLQDVRDEFEFKEALTRAPKIAGIGLNEIDADNLFNNVKAKKEEWQKTGINLRVFKNEGSVQEAEIDVVSKPARPAVEKKLPVEEQDVTIEQILAEKKRNQSQTRVPEISRPPVRQPKAAFPFVEEIKEEDKFLESTAELPAPFETGKMGKEGKGSKEGFYEGKPRIEQPPIRRPEAPVKPSVQQVAPDARPTLARKTDQVMRPQMADVKFESRVYGPVDELAAMTLADFRRLSKDPGQAILKIKTKLEILEGESVTQKSNGIKALKNSPLYKIYAAIMNKALIEGKTFEQVTSERGDITLAEVKAIVDLNKSLKY